MSPRAWSSLASASNSAASLFQAAARARNASLSDGAAVHASSAQFAAFCRHSLGSPGMFPPVIEGSVKPGTVRRECSSYLAARRSLDCAGVCHIGNKWACATYELPLLDDQ